MVAGWQAINEGVDPVCLEIDGDDLFAFIVVEGGLDEFQQSLPWIVGLRLAGRYLNLPWLLHVRRGLPNVGQTAAWTGVRAASAGG